MVRALLDSSDFIATGKALCVCVCVCVRERERGKKNKRVGKLRKGERVID